jgi:hypothetical protein
VGWERLIRTQGGHVVDLPPDRRRDLQSCAGVGTGAGVLSADNVLRREERSRRLLSTDNKSG